MVMVVPAAWVGSALRAVVAAALALAELAATGVAVAVGAAVMAVAAVREAALPAMVVALAAAASDLQERFTRWPQMAAAPLTVATGLS
jgi:hypothetical protein